MGSVGLKLQYTLTVGMVTKNEEEEKDEKRENRGRGVD